MKKIYLAGLLAAGLAVNAQTQVKPGTVSAESRLTTKTNADFTPVSPVVNPKQGTKIGTTGKGLGKNSTWVVVGQTEFDRPTNASNYRRIITYPDGKISVIWSTSPDGSAAGYTGRGTGYNHFNGTSWGNISKARIEAVRTGYPNLDYDAVGGTEIVLAHKATSTNSGGMILSKNGAIGSTSWTGSDVLSESSATVPGVLWPRTVISGDYMIVIGSYTDSSSTQPTRVYKAGVRTPQVYSRLNLRTNTWDVTNEVLPEYDSTRYYAGGGDNYAIDAVGNTVAILMGGLTDDIALWKSTDNGANWTKTIIDSFPIPAFNYRKLVLDTPFSTDGAVSIKLDNAGNAHCFWALGRMFDNDTTAGNTTYSYFPGQNTIAYWYEGRPDSIVSVGFSPDADGSGTLDIGSVIDERTRYGNLSITTAPYSVSSGDSIYVVYQGRTDGDKDDQGQAFTDIFVVASADNGATWTAPLNITSVVGFNTEQTFPSVAADCSSSLHLTFMSTSLQGFFDATNNSGKTGPYDILYYNIPVADIFSRNVVGVNENNTLFSLNQNFPNPFNGTTTVPVKLNSSSDVSISIVNIVGQTVYSNTFENSPAGVNNFELNINAQPGIYFYTVEAGSFKETRKMIIK